MTTRDVDVLVVGGGPVGVLMGALLARDGVQVLVVEANSAPPRSSRAIGIHPPGLDALARVGAAEALLDEAVHVRTGIATSRGRVLGALSFARASATFPMVAAMPLSGTERILRERLDAIAPGTLVLGRRVVGIGSERDGGASAVLADGDTVVARFVVAADGARSPVRAMLGVHRRGRTYRDTYAMGDFADPSGDLLLHDRHHDRHHDRSAVVDVGPLGVVESFPLPLGMRRYVAWTSEPFDDRADDAADTLAAVVRSRTGAGPDPSSCTMLSGFRVRRGIVDRMVHGRVVLIGDAAHEISPIGGQGMNLGWLDAVALAPLLTAAIRSGGALPVDALVAFERRQLRRARTAARQAEWNMRLGRPATGVALLARESVLRAALGSPAAGPLADVYAMRHI